MIFLFLKRLKQKLNRTNILFCDYCNNKIAYASKKCNKCGNILNWLGTKLEYDTNYLICGSCGMILESNANKCERCL